jgi:hypothetical protein
MRFITGLSIAALSIAAASAPAFAKGHDMPADQAQEFGQKVAHNSYEVSEDAKGETDGTKGVDGKTVAGSDIDRGADTVAKPTKPR